MRFVLMCLVTAAAMQMQAASGAPPTAAKLAHCLKSCGDANISYPYGVGAGCFRPGFELTCDHSTKPPKLFLLGNTTNTNTTTTTTKIVNQDRVGYVEASVSFNIAITPGVLGTYNRTWESPGRILSIRPDYYALVAVGCGIEVYLLDPGTDDVLGNCFSMCTDMPMMHKEAEGKACSGMGCCVITFRRPVRAFRVSITQREATQPFQVANASTIKVFLSEWYGTYHYNFTIGDLLSDEINETTVASTSADLLTIVTDQPNCKIAQKDPERYACGDNKCLDADDEHGGYRCACINKFTHSNPYLDGDCDQETEYNPTRDRKNCSIICGNTSIPFPFGLEEGCSGNKRLQLSCVANQTRIGTSPTQYLVTNISLDDGQLVVSRPSTLGENRTHMYEVDDLPAGWSVSLIEDLESFDFSEQYGIWKWAITNVTCEKAKSDTNSYACVSAMSECLIVTNGSGRVRIGYRCKCSAGYQGNPYVKNGCQERKYASTNQHSLFYGVAIGLICGFGVLALMISSIALVKRWKKRIQKKIRRAYFRRNKGMILEQLISLDESIAHNTTIFSLEELEKATNNFDSTRIVGHGGHGTVYKGILSDQRVVAIKRSKIIEQTEVDQFVNEVAILSQVIHRNVVKLYGCCLESEVPLLVYQFISNGTLYDLLHGDLTKKCLLTWGDRIRIALEAARALSYLHYAASIPIFHRDVKSSNILLDDNFITKVSDFGASRSVSIDETHVVTIVQGTFGYLDPEYYHTGKLNEKSDVYSFGVILIELLTRKKPIFLGSMGDKQNLCHHFLQRQEHKTTIEIVDPQVLEEADLREIYEMASLAEICLKLRGEERPTMKEVELRLHLLWGQLTKKSQEEPLYMCKSACLTQYVELATDANLVAHDATRCYTMEQELVSWTSLPR